MKKLLVLLLLPLVTYSQCPLEGDGRNDKEKTLNSLKNRDISYFTPIKLSLDSILKRGEDKDRFNTNWYVSVEGYLNLEKLGGQESCNCHSDNKKDYDFHLQIGKYKTDKGNSSMICEITPKYIGRDTIDFKSKIGKKVRITGYLFYDLEHRHNAINTCNTCTNVWRATCWEIHPVCKIEVIK